MLKTNFNFQPTPIGQAAINASRQVWLAGLGAAQMTRDWVEAGAGEMFKTLVKEGKVVESRAIRVIGDRIESSISVANTLWKETRKNVESTVKVAADTAVNIAQQVLPASLPKFALPVQPKAVRATQAPKRAKRTVKVARKTKRVARVAKRG